MLEPCDDAGLLTEKSMLVYFPLTLILIVVILLVVGSYYYQKQNTNFWALTTAAIAPLETVAIWV
jgi:uncharacterized protein (UPF0333 family)